MPLGLTELQDNIWQMEEDQTTLEDVELHKSNFQSQQTVKYFHLLSMSFKENVT